jgi:bifunctional oligoribonuclease and PAP phosphatase NrnA
MLKKIADAINRHENFLLTSHVRPDGDSIGSTLALYHMLRDMGKSVVVYNQDRTPGNYQFLPGTGDIIHELPAACAYDVVFILDCSELERIGEDAGKITTGRLMINIDHHISNKQFCELAFIDGHASSTAELLFRLADVMNIHLTKDIANNLYTGILTDTGGFRYGSTSRESLAAASLMVACGADPQWLSENIYENNPEAKIRLLTKVLETLSFDLDGKVASLVVYRKSLDATGAIMEHTEGFVDVPRSIAGVVVSILFSEMNDNQYKISLRSKGQYNIARVAEKFGGGGHTNAAACRYRGDIVHVKESILNTVANIF